MVKIERCSIAPASLEAEKMKTDGICTCKDVINQLVHDFYNKCYICDMSPSHIEVEHRLPHHNGIYPDRKFDWNNLFLACTHCNTVKKKKKYEEGILDCCVDDPEVYLDFVFDGNNVCVNVKKENSSCQAKLTAELIEEAFAANNTGILKRDSEFLLTHLQEEMIVLFDKLVDYSRTNDIVAYNTIKNKLGLDAEFSSFARAYIRRNASLYPDFVKLL